jgi:phosphoserine phosphatase RsbU/P
LARRAEEETQTQKVIASQFREQEHEIAEARAIQEGLLPKEIPQLPGYEIAATWQSARIVGGDYFDVLPLSDGMLGLCIADVAGKGMPAALLMSNLQAAVRGLASPSLAPDELCVRLNTLLCRNMASDRFVTLFYAQLDGASGTLRYVTAGHNPPFVMHADGAHERLRDGGSVLGVFPNPAFTLGTANLRPGDVVVLFTDGVTEARDADDDEFGDDRLLAVLAESRASSVRDIQKEILQAATNFTHGPLQSSNKF